MSSGHRSRSPFAIRLRQFREEATLTQGELAERTGLSVRGISDLERGLRTAPRLETVRMLADGLGLTVEQRAELLRSRHQPENQSSPRPTRMRGNLPLPPTTFFGREQEIERIHATLASGTYRLITLVGPGGIGKTRTAIEAVRSLPSNLSDNLVFIDLSLVRDPRYVMHAIADGLGIPVRGENELDEILLVSLQERRTLLVLDNMEQVIEAANRIAWLLQECPDLCIIITSRGVLNISAERVIPIEPMALPSVMDLESLQHMDAIRLFVARISAVGHSLELTSENAAIVAAIVTRLQGIPLAIELAAARIHLFSLPELLNRLTQPLQVLDGGYRDAPDRHRGMRDTIAWSYDLLSASEQCVFRSVSIFPNGCTLTTATAILGEVDGLEERGVEDAIDALVHGSMISSHIGQDGTRRFRMLEILREFGNEQLDRLEKRTSLQLVAHQHWCLPLVRQAEYVYIQPNAVDGLHRFDEEYRNLQEHLSWLISNGHQAEALEVSGAIAAYRALRGYLGEGRAELELLLNAACNQENTSERGRALIGLGIILVQQGDAAAARAVLEEGEYGARELSELRHLVTSLSWQSVVLVNLGDNDQAEAKIQEARSVASAIGDHAQMCGVTLIRAFIAENIGDRDLAFQLTNDGLARAQALDITWFTAIAKLSLSAQHIIRGDLDSAEIMVLEARDLYAQLGDRRDLPAIYLNLATISRERGDLQTAHDNLAQALEVARDTGSMGSIAESYLGLARLSLIQGRSDAARSQLVQACYWWMRCGYQVDAVRCLEEFVEIALDTGNAYQAVWIMGAIENVISTLNQRRTEVSAGEHDCHLARSRSMLSPAEWREQYERGHSLTLDEVLAEMRSTTLPISDDALQYPGNQDRS
ncbi:MAG: helix-turn-helix domain-containing protein [Thermomicrobiales bacterium]|nr:helix-turn-helix domain-containing protein [Thermomicrobiales bacterium]MCO5217431.1 helix-turn-helix domain-containing protein [Thermomicrobiales bacterium]MCO5226049.1 helix-turn-helix domain-containing protein [Thermomicrobiales bacterium]MCO5226735.1 helix-turn-helix domain-containing protein [Thermomicrobiales bacterium]